MSDNYYNEDIDEFQEQDEEYNQIFYEYIQEEEDKYILEEKEKEKEIFDDILLDINFDDLIEQDNEEDIENRISLELETRIFQNDPNSFLNSRVGMAERIGQEQVLGTEIGGYGKLAQRQNKLFQMSTTPNQMFKMNLEKIAYRYDISKNLVNNVLDIVFKVPFFEYKNPGGCLFGLMCLSGKNIDKKLIKKIYDTYASEENMSILDLVRYSRFMSLSV